MKNINKLIYLLLGLVIIVVILFVALDLHNNANKNSKDASTNTCISKQLTVGSSGVCVSDAQTMVDFLESDGLNQCPFVGADSISPNGVYGTATQNQIKVVQNWFNCYNKQEDETATINPNGILTPSTWSEMCTYAYIYPSQSQQSTSPYLKQSIAAGQNAGCIKS